MKATVPDNFLSHYNVATRQNAQWYQLNAWDIIRGIKEFKVKDTYCILAVTNNDLYPRDSWNFVFSLADMTNRCGVFSFARHAVQGFEGTDMTEEQRQLVTHRRSCSTMVHEIGHMFGLQHCIHYECTMNGSNGSFELAAHPNRTLCPICLAKLKINCKFDCRERYNKLIEASQEFGFLKDVAFYAEIIADVHKQAAAAKNRNNSPKPAAAAGGAARARSRSPKPAAAAAASPRR